MNGFGDRNISHYMIPLDLQPTACSKRDYSIGVFLIQGLFLPVLRTAPETSGFRGFSSTYFRMGLNSSMDMHGAVYLCNLCTIMSAYSLD